MTLKKELSEKMPMVHKDIPGYKMIIYPMKKGRLRKIIKQDRYGKSDE